jgi:hypothetical protein
MKVFDLLLAVSAVITGTIVLMRLSRGEFYTRFTFVGVVFIAGGLIYLWKHRPK